MTDDLYGLYDRQIRLFGRDTQEKIENAYVCVIQGPVLIINRKERVIDVGGEILKNLILLGVRKIFTNEDVTKSFSRVSPNEIHKTNEEVEIKTDGDDEVYDIIILIDQEDTMKNNVGIYVCSKCMSFNDIRNDHVCREYVLGDNAFANDCLLGAIVVQEWIKRLQNGSCVEEYQLKL